MRAFILSSFLFGIYAFSCDECKREITIRKEYYQTFLESLGNVSSTDHSFDISTYFYYLGMYYAYQDCEEISSSKH